MTGEDIDIQGLLFTGAFLLAFLLGLRASIRLARTYRRVLPEVDPRNRPILLIIVIASWILTLAAGWIGGLSMLRILTSAVFPWTPPITLVIATAVVFIPVMFDVAITRVTRAESEPWINRVVRYLLELQTGHIPTDEEVEDEKASSVARPIIDHNLDKET